MQKYSEKLSLPHLTLLVNGGVRFEPKASYTKTLLLPRSIRAGHVSLGACVGTSGGT